MRKILILLGMMLLLTTIGMAQYQVNCLFENGETMTFRVVGYGKNAKIASDDGEQSVIKALMYHGIPNTQQSVPMVSQTEAQSMNENGEFLKSFFYAEYKNVITKSVIVRKFGKDENKQKSIGLEVTVNIRALRNELTRNGVIRRFGL